MLNSMYRDDNGVPCFAVRVYASDISTVPVDGWYERMPQSRKVKIDKLKREDDRKRGILSYALLEIGMEDLANDLGDDVTKFVDGGLPEICTDENGKPYFADSPVRFNISHSGDRVMVAISSQDVGCDVEKRCSNAESVAKRFFHEKEYAAIAAANDDIRDDLFRTLWTLKESVVKCSGQGLRIELGSFCTTDDDGRIRKSITVDGTDYHMHTYEIGDGYSYSVCSVYDNIEDRIRWIPIE